METFLWPLLVFHCIVGVVGVPGNALVISVFAKKRQKTIPRVFILALASADLVVCLFTPVTIYHWVTSRSYTSGLLCRVVISMTFIMVYNSCFLTSAIAVDRYQAICQPHRRWMTVPRAKFTAVFCVLLAVLVSVSVFVSYDVDMYTEDPVPSGRCTVSTKVPSAVTYFMYSVVYVASLSTLALNIILYVKMYRSIRSQAKICPRLDVANESTTNPSGPTTRRSATVPTVSATFSQPKTTLSSGSRFCPPENPTSLDNAASLSDIASGSTNCIIPQLHHQHQQEGLHQQPFVQTNRRSDRPTGCVQNQQAGSQRVIRGKARQLYTRTTRMLVITTVVFFSTWLLALLVLSLPPNIYKSIRDNSELGYSLLHLLRYIFYLNNAINPFIYGFVNRRFRADCKETLNTLRCFRL